MHTGSVLKNPKNQVFRANNPLFEKFSNSVPKEFMITPIHILCSNLKETGLWEVGEMMHCSGDKKFAKCIFAAILTCLVKDAKSLQGACHMGQGLPIKFRPNGLHFACLLYTSDAADE